ncbi:KRI1-like family C-terminal-domain-containing protein [Gamsiella multidivaricata]|uniref:KRI1-like family C-terminal-domain-containing protein n=1 Tax=Gamsiella multidivaricata TaxID=101098 RepID=UPI00221F7665|nr:KRI1-like family C-terminal-domain-containing protein [Gamsiella multidivaricata]KAG0369944.1 KRRI-Interacting protein 1 [Gamsiella multidivaricata]KAI7820649.1 KRI1-like family C-terminal-domain-containing protein [Gamsiella multidivaricata]
MDLSNSEEITLNINKEYAEKYEATKRNQELSAIRDKYGDLEEKNLELIAERQHKYGYTKNADYDYDSCDSEEDEEEDEDGELITAALDGQIMKTIGLIRAQDPKIYEATNHFFIPSEMEEARKRWKEKQKEEKKNKPMNLKDYHRKVLIENNGIVNEDAEDKKVWDESKVTHVEQQERLKKEMKSAFLGGGDDDDGDDSFFTQKAKTKEEEEAEEEDYKRFLMESMGSSKAGTNAFQDWREYKNAPDMDKDEAFLMDYILNRGWIDKSQKKTLHYKEIIREDELDDLENSEDELDAAEEYESKYNFRFEDAQGDSLVSYARTVDDSVRNRDDRRKKRRQAAKERKKEEKIKQLEELKRAKNLKKQEIFNKLKQIQEITGNKTVGFDEIDLETEFDPVDYDQRMENVFSDKYYEGDENAKPVFEDDIDTADYEQSNNEDSEGEEYNDDGEENGKENEEEYPEDESYYGYDDEGYCGGNDEYYNEDYGEDECRYGDEDDDIMMDADYLPGGEKCGETQGKKKTKEEQRKGRADGTKTAVAAIEAARSTLDIEKEKKDFNAYLNEYYQLDYEDMVGDIPTRFKYHKVKPATFGLTPVEILLADDKDLNEFISLKKFAPYRRPDLQDEDARKFSKKKRVQMFRHKLKTQIQQQRLELDKNWDPAQRRKKENERRMREEEEEASAKKNQERQMDKDKQEEGKDTGKGKGKKKKKNKKRKAVEEHNSEAEAPVRQEQSHYQNGSKKIKKNEQDEDVKVKAKIKEEKMQGKKERKDGKKDKKVKEGKREKVD